MRGAKIFVSARPPANIDSVEPGHEPIQDQERRWIRQLQLFPCLLAVSSDDDLVAPPGEGCFQEPPRCRVVFGDKNSHAASFKNDLISVSNWAKALVIAPRSAGTRSSFRSRASDSSCPASSKSARASRFPAAPFSR